MASKTLKFIIGGVNKLGPVVASVKRSLSAIRAGAGRTFSILKSATKSAVLGITGLVAAVTGLAALYSKQEDAENDLAAAIRKRGENVDELLPKLKQQAAAIQAVTTHGDEEVIALQSLGMNMGIATDKTDEATRAALGLSKAYGVDTVAAMRLVARAANGDTASLTRYGITLDKTLDDQGRFNQLLQIGARNFSLVEAETGTLSGKFKQFRNTLGDVGEKFGGALVKGLKLKEFFESAAPKVEAFGTSIAKRVLPYIERLRDIMADIFAGGDRQTKGIENLKKSLARAFEIVKPHAIDLGKAIASGFLDGIQFVGKKVQNEVDSTWVGKGVEDFGKAFDWFDIKGRMSAIGNVDRLAEKTTQARSRNDEWLRAPTPVVVTNPKDILEGAVQ